MKKTLAAVALLASAALTSPASAITLLASDTGVIGTTILQGASNNNGQLPQPINVPGLTASLFLEYDGLSNNGLTWNFDYTVTNTTSATLPNTLSSILTGFGLLTTPNVTGADSTGTFDNALWQVQAGFLGIVDFCATTGQTCGGGDPQTGLQKGQSASGEFSLTFANVLDFITLDGAFGRWQAINGVVDGITYNGASGFGQAAVVPAPLVGAGIPGLLAMCLGMFGLNRYRRRRIA
jgi:hypothetical protein